MRRLLQGAVNVMKVRSPFRLSLATAAVLLLAVSPALARGFGQKNNQQARAAQRAEARAESRSAEQVPQFRPAPNPSVAAPQREEHLEKWMESHSNLSLPDLQRALQNEPGFRELPPQVQQNRLNTLARLYNMSPQQRTRMLKGVEGLERLTPQQQQQWDRAVLQLNANPVPRRRLMIRAIADLREMPPDQREQVIDSPAFSAQFSPDERQTIRTILTAY